MTPYTILAKSPKGVEEIDTRVHRLSGRLRQVLIRVDGAKTLDELIGEAGEMGEMVLAQLNDLVAQGFLMDVTPLEETLPPIAPALPPTPVPLRAAAPPPRPAAAPAPVARPAAPAAAAAPRLQPVPTRPAAAAPAPATVAFDSPVKFKLQDLLVDAVGVDTGRIGAALNNCRNRDDLVRWVALAIEPIKEKAGKAKAKTFEKAARQLVGG